MGLSMMSILTLGVLNRVMIQELAIPATIVAGILAIPLDLLRESIFSMSF